MFKRLFGGLIDSNEKEVEKLQPLVDSINSLEEDYERLSAEELRAKTADFKGRVREAVAGFQDELKQAKTELEEKRKCEDEASNELARQEITRECKSLEAQLRDGAGRPGRARPDQQRAAARVLTARAPGCEHLHHLPLHRPERHPHSPV